jgi:hypothetical protein
MPELIVGIVLVTFFALISIRTVIAAQQLLPGRAALVGGVVLSIAPSLPAFADAVRVHTVFIQRIQAARAVYVFGGSHQGIPANASRRSLAPLSIQGLPMIDTSSTGLPTDAFAFLEAYSSRLGTAEVAYDPADFTVVVLGVIGGTVKVTSLVQVRTSRVSLADGASSGDYVQRTVELYDISGESLNYSFLEKAALAAEEAVGAHHFWYRYSEGRVAEEGPCVVTFPDPWSWSQVSLSSPMPALSRFVYCLPVST